MGEVMMKQKGVILTLTILLFSLAIIGLSSQLRENTRLLEQNAQFVSAIDRVAYKFENVQDNIYDIMLNVGNMDFDSNAEAIWFYERLPEKTKKDTYQIDLDSYREFVALHSDALDVNINSATIDVRDLLISPYDINYTHSKDKGRYYNEITYSPATLNFEGYFIDITLQNQDYNGIITNVKTSPGSNIGLDVIIRNSVKITENELHYADVDPTKDSDITIKTSGQAHNDIVITITPTGVLTITNNNSVPIDINSGINFGALAIEMPVVELPENLVVVGAGGSDYNIIKTTKTANLKRARKKTGKPRRT